MLEAIELYSEGSVREGSTKQSSNDGAVEVKVNSVSELGTEGCAIIFPVGI